MRLRVTLAASVAKDPQRQDLNEDAFVLGDTRFALSDGASESYDSKNWARLLTSAYLEDHAVSVEWVSERARSYQHTSDFASLSWARQAAFERGSFATLLGLELAPNLCEAVVLAIGDSLAVHVRNGVKLDTFPFQHAEEFDARPRLLSTLAIANDFVGEPDFFTRSSTTWHLKPNDQILLVTDAVGHWLLAHEDALTALDAVKTSAEFERLVITSRVNKSMRLDDSTILRFVTDSEDPETPV